MVDLTSALMQFNNKEFIAELSQPILHDDDGKRSVSLLDLHEQIQAFKGVLARAPAGDEAEQAGVDKLKKLLNDVSRGIDNLRNGVPLSQRLATALASLALYPLPFLTAHFQHEEQYLTLVCAAYAKTAAMAIGYVRNDRSDLKLFMHHLKGRHSVFLYPAAAYTIPAFVKTAHEMQTNIPYGVGAGIFTAAALVATFYRKEVTHVFKRVTGTLNDKGKLPEMVQEEAIKLIAALQESKAGVQQLRDRSGAISDHLSTQLSFHNESAASLEDQLKDMLSADNQEKVSQDEQAGRLAGVGGKSNPDVLKKLGFGLTAAIVTYAVAAMHYPELLGTVDLGIDATFVTAIMLHMAAKHFKTEQDAFSEFKTFAGLSLAALAFTSANKLTGYLDKEGGFASGAIGLTASNLFVAGPLAYVVATGLTTLMQGAGQAFNYMRSPSQPAQPNLEANRIAPAANQPVEPPLQEEAVSAGAIEAPPDAPIVPAQPPAAADGVHGAGRPRTGRG